LQPGGTAAEGERALQIIEYNIRRAIHFDLRKDIERLKGTGLAVAYAEDCRQDGVTPATTYPYRELVREQDRRERHAWMVITGKSESAARLAKISGTMRIDEAGRNQILSPRDGLSGDDLQNVRHLTAQTINSDPVLRYVWRKGWLLNVAQYYGPPDSQGVAPPAYGAVQPTPLGGDRRYLSTVPVAAGFTTGTGPGSSPAARGRGGPPPYSPPPGLGAPAPGAPAPGR